MHRALRPELTLGLAAIALSLGACQTNDSRAESVKTPPAAPSAQPGEGAGQAAAPEAAPANKTPLKIAAPTAQSGGSVQVTVVPQFDRVTAGDTKTLNLLVKLEGVGEVIGERPPLDLALIIDRSGSMSGDKIRDVKTAALQLLDNLRPDDTVTLITYSNDVRRHTTRLPVDKMGKETLRNHLLGIESGGGTALGPALMRALDDLEAGKRDDLRLTHAMLLSDGLANQGESRPEVLGARSAQAFSRGISVSTLGVGLDYNEDLMTKLADQGGGRYHFIEDGNAVASILGDEMKGLVATVARRIELEFTPSPGAGVGKVYGYATDRMANTVTARIGSVGAKQTREIIIELALPALALPKANLGQMVVRFIDVTADGAARSLTVPLGVEVTDNAEAMTASEHKDVTVRVAEVEAAEKLEAAARAADRGDFDAAQGALQLAVDDLKRKAEKAPSPKLDAQIRDLEEARDEVKQARTSQRAKKAYTKKYKEKAYKGRKK